VASDTLKTKFKKTMALGLGGVAVLLSALIVTTALRQHRTFDAPRPAIRASLDPAVIERGRYLALGAAHCGECHGAGKEPGAPQDATVLSGGIEFHLPVGTFRVPNITPDRETGIGRYSDDEIARMLRYGVRPNGEALLPFMPFSDLSDADLGAVIAFLRSQKPVKHAVLPHDVNWLGKIVKAFVLEPRGPSGPTVASLPPEVTPAYGRYLAHSVGNCVGCHTKVDLRTGALAAPIFSGGAVHPSTQEQGKSFVAPNLTPDPRWGWLEGWSETAFVSRLRAGGVHQGSPMPWEAFSRISEDDARAVYRYLKTLPPVAGGPDPKDRNSVAKLVAER
jgi:mono/diheme cytochrome c family protein